MQQTLARLSRGSHRDARDGVPKLRAHGVVEGVKRGRPPLPPCLLEQSLPGLRVTDKATSANDAADATTAAATSCRCRRLGRRGLSLDLICDGGGERVRHRV